jgi:hypothetical protein
MGTTFGHLSVNTMNTIPLQVNDWKNSNIQVFWGEIAPSDHLVQLYENERYFLETLEGFAGCGLLSGDSVIIIATQEHLDELNSRLRGHGFDVDQLMSSDHYIPLEANETLSRFLVNNWPDHQLFDEFISKVIERGQRDGRNVRAFGEMVSILWGKGHHGATVQLENLWHQLHSKNKFTLYCAYPKSGFTQDVQESLDTICKAHSKIIDGHSRPSTEIYYQNA